MRANPQEGFSPRNGEVILKLSTRELVERAYQAFQSPQWGSNSKVLALGLEACKGACFSPRNGEVILKFPLFQTAAGRSCFSPHNGEVILKFSILGFNIIKK